MRVLEPWESDRARLRVSIGWWLMGFGDKSMRLYYLGKRIAGLVICDSCNGVGGWMHPCGDCCGGRKALER